MILLEIGLFIFFKPRKILSKGLIPETGSKDYDLLKICSTTSLLDIGSPYISMIKNREPTVDLIVIWKLSNRYRSRIFCRRIGIELSRRNGDIDISVF